MDLAKVTAILDLLAGMSATPEIIGKERLKSFEERADRVLHGGSGLTPLSFYSWMGDPRASKIGFFRREDLLQFWPLLILSLAGTAAGTYYWYKFVWEAPPAYPVILVLPYATIVSFGLFCVLIFGLNLVLMAVMIGAPFVVGMVCRLLYALSVRTELSRSLLLLGFFLFFLSGALKIAFL